MKDAAGGGGGSAIESDPIRAALRSIGSSRIRTSWIFNRKNAGKSRSMPRRANFRASAATRKRTRGYPHLVPGAGGTRKQSPVTHQPTGSHHRSVHHESVRNEENADRRAVRKLQTSFWKSPASPPIRSGSSGSFRTVSGMDSGTEVIEFKRGTTPSSARSRAAPRFATSSSSAATPRPTTCGAGGRTSKAGIIDRRSGTFDFASIKTTELNRGPVQELRGLAVQVVRAGASSSGLLRDGNREIELAVEKIERALK